LRPVTIRVTIRGGELRRSIADHSSGRATTRRDFLTVAAATAGAAMTPDLAHAHEHEHQAVPSDPVLRVKALESLR